MPQFGPWLAATSNPFCVNGEEFLSGNRENARRYGRRALTGLARPAARRHCSILILPALATRKSGDRGGY